MPEGMIVMSSGENEIQSLIESFNRPVFAISLISGAKYTNNYFNDFIREVEIPGLSKSEVHNMLIAAFLDLIKNEAKLALDSKVIVSLKKDFHFQLRKVELEIEIAPFSLISDSYAFCIIKKIADKNLTIETIIASDKFNALFSNSGIAVFVLNHGGEIIRANEKFKNMLGYKDQDFNHLSLFYIVDSYYSEKYLEVISALFSGFIKEFNSEVVVKNKNGEDIWCFISMSPVVNSNGECLSILCLMHDIGDRKKYEDDIQQSELEKNVILEALEDHVILLDNNENVLWANRAALEYGNKISYYENQCKCFEFLHDENKICKNCPYRLTLNDGKTHSAHTKTDDNNDWIIQSLPIKNSSGVLNGAVVVRRNITDYIIARDEIRASREKFRQAIDIIPFAVFAKDSKGKFILANKETADYYGMQVRDLIGKYQIDLQYNKEDALRMLDEDKFIIENQIPIDNDDELVADLKGNIKHYKIRKIPFTPFGSNEKCVLGISIDISEKINLQKQLMQSHKFEALGRLAGGVAHDFNNYMTAIVGLAEITMIEFHHFPNIDERMEQLKDIAIRASNLTKQLLAYSKKQEIKHEIVNLNSIILNLNLLIERLIKPTIRISFQLTDSLHDIIGDAGQIEQIVMNLVVNARDAVDDNGTIEIKTVNSKINNFAKSNNRYYNEDDDFVCLSIKDNGCGIDKSILDNIFDPFFTTKNESNGTGLGLSVVYGIVEQHNGFIKVESEIDKGTEFLVYIPAYTNKH